MAVLLKLGQILFVLDLLLFLAAANSAQRGIDRQAIKPSRELGFTLERFDFTVSGQEDILNNLFRVGGLAENFLGYIVKFSRVKIEDRLQGRLVSCLEAFDDFRVVGCGL